MPDRRNLELLERPEPGWPVWVEQWVLPYVQNPDLRPVLVALLGHLVVILTPLILAAHRTGSVGVIVALAVLGIASASLCAFEVVRFRRPGAVSAVVVVTWLLGIGLAVVAQRSGVF